MSARASRQASAPAHRKARCLLFALLLPAVAAGSPCTNPDSPPPRRIELQPGREAAIDLPPATHAALLEEAGGDVRYGLDGAPAQREIATRPPRLGVAALPMGTRRVSLLQRPGQAPSTVLLRTDCVGQAEADFYAQLDRWFVDWIDVGASRAEGLLRDLETELATATDARRNAWLRMTNANALMAVGQGERAAIEFSTAARSWDLLGEGTLAAVSRLASAENSARAGAYDAAEPLLREARAALLETGAEYYSLRAASALCLLTGRRGDLHSAIECDEQVANRYMQAGERAEAGARNISMAQQWMKLGELERARARLVLADGDVDVLTPVARTRLGLAFGKWHLLSGDLPAAAREMSAAADGLRERGLPQEQSAIDLVLSRLAGIAGAEVEELRLVERALSRLPSNASADMSTAALLRLAEIHAARQDHEKVEGASLQASAECARFGKLDCLAVARVMRAESWIARGEAERAEKEIAGMRLPEGSLVHPALDRVRARLIGLSDPGAALRTLGPPNPGGLDLEGVLLRTDLLARSGRRTQAREQLAAAMLRAAGQVSTWPEPALRVAARNRLARLRAVWIDLLGEPHAQQSDARSEREIAAVLNALSLARVGSGAPSPVSAQRRMAWSDALLGGGALDARDAILGLLEIDEGRVVAGIEQAGLPARLPVDQTLLLPLPGREHFRLMAQSDGVLRVCASVPSADYARQVAAFDGAIAGAAANLPELDREALEWFRLIQDCHSENPARRWLVVATPAARQLPWEWIAARAPAAGLAEPTVTRLFRVPAEPPGEVVERVAGLRVHDLNLPGSDRLPFAEAEKLAIREALADAGIAIDVTSGRTAAADLLRALGSEQWIHVIGHAHAGREAPLFSGIWLPAARGPSLLTFPELAGHTSRARLVVLSACGSGPDGAAESMVNLDLAEALISAGAQQVVAASHALSDSAAPVWTRTFYAAFRQSGNAALALREARGQLRRSPHFRHPRFWAGLNHYGGFEPDRPATPAEPVQVPPAAKQGSTS